MGNDTWGLFRKILRRKQDFGFQRDLVSYVLAVKDLAYIPFLLSHVSPPGYTVIV